MTSCCRVLGHDGSEIAMNLFCACCLTFLFAGKMKRISTPPNKSNWQQEDRPWQVEEAVWSQRQTLRLHNKLVSVSNFWTNRFVQKCVFVLFVCLFIVIVIVVMMLSSGTRSPGQACQHLASLSYHPAGEVDDKIEYLVINQSSGKKNLWLLVY